jgi:hypothetical protein
MEQFLFFADHFGVATAVMVVLGFALWIAAGNMAEFCAPLIVQHFEAATTTAETTVRTSANISSLMSRIDETSEGARQDHADLAHLIREAKFAAEMANLAATKAAKTSEQILDLLVGIEDNETH